MSAWWPKGEPFVWPRGTDRALTRLVERTCTEREIEVLKMKAHGFGRRRIATIVGVSESAVRDRLRRATLKIALAMEIDDQEVA